MATFSISFCEAVRAAALAQGLARFMLETDAPYLPPQGQRGKRNYPANVGAVVRRIAELRELPAADVSMQVHRNAETVFGFQARRMSGGRR